MVLGVDGAGTVDALGEGVTRFSLGERIFGQLLLAPIGSTGTYAEYVAVTAEAPLASVPEGLDLIEAAAVPTVGGTGLTLVESLEPLEDKTVLVVGAGGGVGSFATQYAVIAGARVIANVRAPAEERVRSYGVAETIDHTTVPLAEAVRQAHPDGIDVLVDLASDAESFASLASLVRPGGAAVSTRYVADTRALSASGIRGANFVLAETSEVLERLAEGSHRSPDRPAAHDSASPWTRCPRQWAPGLITTTMPRPSSFFDLFRVTPVLVVDAPVGPPSVGARSRLPIPANPDVFDATLTYRGRVDRSSGCVEGWPTVLRSVVMGAMSIRRRASRAGCGT